MVFHVAMKNYTSPPRMAINRHSSLPWVFAGNLLPQLLDHKTWMIRLLFLLLFSRMFLHEKPVKILTGFGAHLVYMCLQNRHHTWSFWTNFCYISLPRWMNVVTHSGDVLESSDQIRDVKNKGSSWPGLYIKGFIRGGSFPFPWGIKRWSTIKNNSSADHSESFCQRLQGLSLWSVANCVLVQKREVLILARFVSFTLETPS